MKKAIVIGAGIAGLAVAIRLKKQGYTVTIFESNATVGGKAAVYNWNNYRFDCGPSLFTLPHLVDELWALCGKNPRDYFNYLPLDVVIKYFYEHNLEINSYTNPIEFAKEIKNKLGVEEKVILAFIENQKITYNKVAPVFLENSIHQWRKILRWKMIAPLLHLMKIRFLFSMNMVNTKYFKNAALVKLFNRYGTYNGSNPYKMPSLFNIISHLELSLGAYIPADGIHSIPDAMYRLALEEGINFRFNTIVNQINYTNHVAHSITANDQTHEANVIVSNMDVNLTYKQLLPNFKAPKKYLTNEISTSALIFLWALKLETPNLQLHNIIFAADYEKEFDSLFNKKEYFQDPTIYINISSKIVKNDAPEGCENWFVMINAPHLSKPYLESNTAMLRKIIIEKINARLGIDIEKSLLYEKIITPTAIAATSNAYLGSLYGASSNSMLSGFWRHPNFSKLKNLYFCGGTVHPGGGIPLCLRSAKIAAELIQENH